MDTKAIAVRIVQDACKMFRQDLEALPDEAFGQRFGDRTRTVADIVYEVNLANDHIGMTLRGEAPLPWPEGGWIKAPEGFRSKEAVIAAFDRSCQAIVATAEALSAEAIEATVRTERGETTRFERFQFVAMHLWYHSGQLNYIQTLRGDDAWHWS
ncbi:MAG: DinB family protein [Fimbriimonadaceae bacterium]|nr:DinB family protein [Fimbriimonadaceae bacterium]